MKSIRKTLRSLWVRVSLAGIACALIFILGPHISVGESTPLDDLGSQIAASMVILGYAVGVALQSKLDGVRAYFEDLVQSQVSDALDGTGAERKKANPASSDPDVVRAGTAAEKELQTTLLRLRETLTILKGRRLAGIVGKSWLYQRPWYLVIGPPGSGKTTAIVNCGLSFPLADRSSRRALGRTRSCEWWIADEAVLIDAAGRYTIHESDSERDKAAWRGLLRLLRRYRPRQPLNGVLVTIAISDLNSTSDDVSVDQASCIRQRLLELNRELRLQLPVYVLFTKSDLAAGFVEFFGELGGEGTEAVCGFTFAREPSEGDGDPMESYIPAYDALVGRLNERLLERMQQESNPQGRALIFDFPQQVASLKYVTEQFLQEAFARNPFQEPIMLRGVYFVSGTQVGTRFDRVAEARSQIFEVARPPCPGLPGPRRSYFIGRLLRDVVFAEAELVDADPRFLRRQRRVRYGVYAIGAAAMIAAGVFWTVTYVRNVTLIESVRLTADSYAAEAKKLNLDRVDNSELRPILPLLQRLRNIRGGNADGDTAGDRLAGLGLDQSKKISLQARAAYHRALNTVLLPRLISRLETLLAETHDPLFLYEVLNVYLMLGKQAPLQREVVKNWMAVDWRVMFPAEADADLRHALADHLDALLDPPLPHVALNSELIEKSRAKLQAVSMPRGVFDIIATSPAASQPPTSSLDDHAAPLAETVLVRKSGQPLSAKIPGLYTRMGFYGTFLHLLPQVADAVAAESWVLDAQAVAPAAAGDVSQQLRRPAADLHPREFAFRRDQLIGDVSLRPIGTMDDALRTLDTPTAPTSPMLRFLVATAQKLRLEQRPAPEDGMTKGNGVAKSEAPPTDVAELIRSRAVADKPEAYVRLYMDDHLRWLHQRVDILPNSQVSGQAPIDSALQNLGELYRSLSQTQGLTGSDCLEKDDQAGVAIRQIESGATNLPEPIKQ